MRTFVQNFVALQGGRLVLMAREGSDKPSLLVHCGSSNNWNPSMPVSESRKMEMELHAMHKAQGIVWPQESKNGKNACR